MAPARSPSTSTSTAPPARWSRSTASPPTSTAPTSAPTRGASRSRRRTARSATGSARSASTRRAATPTPSSPAARAGGRSRRPPQAIVDGCLVGYRWDAATASYVNRDGVAKPSGLGRGFNPGKPTVVVLGQSVDLILANALQRVDPSRNYVALPCDDPEAASFDYGRWTAAVRDWLKPELPRIDYLSVGITHRGLCPRRIGVGDIAVARLRELRALLPTTGIAALNYPLHLDRAMTDAAYATYFACFDPGYPNNGTARAYAYEQAPPRYRSYVETASAGPDVIDVWTATYKTTDGIHADAPTAEAAARTLMGYLR